MGQIYTIDTSMDVYSDAGAISTGITFFTGNYIAYGNAYRRGIVAVDTIGVKYGLYSYNHTDGGTVIAIILAYSSPFSLKFVIVDSNNNVVRTWPTATITTDEQQTGLGCSTFGSSERMTNPSTPYSLYASKEELIDAIGQYATKDITYRLTNCTAPSAPSEAASGATVVVSLVFSEGFGIVNPTDAYVMNDGVQVSSLFNPNDNTITFTMP